MNRAVTDVSSAASDALANTRGQQWESQVRSIRRLEALKVPSGNLVTNRLKNPTSSRGG